MKHKSRVFAISALMAVLLSVCVWAAETADPNVVTKPEFQITVSHVNPEYERLGVKFAKPSADCMTTAETTVVSMEEAAVYLREQMENRVTEVTITVSNYTYVSDDQLSADWITILYDAFEHTGVSTQGDYILRHYDGAAGKLGRSGIFQYTITYGTTLEQENTVGERIDELFAQWDTECGFYELSDYEQVKIIYDYICENVTYDYANLEDDSYALKYTAYAALINGTSVCQGYSNLFYRMVLEAEIDNRIVVGYGNGGYHSWNIVELGEMYYYLDSTWDAPRASAGYAYDYFLLGSENFCLDHIPDSTYEFDCKVEEYPIDTENYDPASVLAAPTPTVSNVASSGKPRLSWKKVDGAEKYEVWRSTSEDGGFVKAFTTTGTTYTNTAAKAGTLYYYKVCAVSGDTQGEFSSIVSSTCDLARPTVTVSNVASSGKPRLSWTKVDGAEKYEVYRSTSKDSGFVKAFTTTGTAYTNTTAEAGTLYYYKVRAICGNSAAASEYCTVSGTCDLARPTVTVSNVASSGKIRLTWTAVSGATKYEVYRSTSKDSGFVKAFTTAGTAYTNTTAEAGTLYYYKVRAICGNSAAASAYCTVSGTCDLARPVVAITLSDSGKPKLTWTAVTGATRYEVYRSTSENGTYTRTYTTSGTSYINSSAEPGVTYYYKVRAICAANSEGNSAYSAVQAVTAE